MTALAPVSLFVYNRPEHTARVLAALAGNELAEHTALYIHADGPKTADALPAVEAVRRVIREVRGFGHVTLIEQEINRGLANSIIGGVTAAVKEYGRVIVLEDDLVTSPYFLRYMNEALDKYADEQRVVSIQGYVYPLKKPFARPFFLVDTGCWGWATWRRGWDLFEPDGVKLLAELRARNLTRQFDLGNSFHFTRILEEQTLGLNDSWAIRWQASAFLRGLLTLYPPSSLVSNIGFDGTGVHCDVTRYFDVAVCRQPVILDEIPVVEDIFALKAFQQYLRRLQGPAALRAVRKVYGYVRGLVNAPRVF